ncbi:hypothetical protein [Alienimonas sp. DA493]|uniref:hypothetical protein n=1 Tax=Alienimonas sp. DA493 TaxID=3373605 RepID=UPI0037551FBD
MELGLFAVAVAGLFLHRHTLPRVVCPACGGRRCSSAPVLHLVAGSEGARTTAHRCRVCGTYFVLIGGDPARSHVSHL